MHVYDLLTRVNQLSGQNNGGVGLMPVSHLPAKLTTVSHFAAPPVQVMKTGPAPMPVNSSYPAQALMPPAQPGFVPYYDTSAIDTWRSQEFMRQEQRGQDILDRKAILASEVTGPQGKESGDGYEPILEQTATEQDAIDSALRSSGELKVLAPATPVKPGGGLLMLASLAYLLLG